MLAAYSRKKGENKLHAVEALAEALWVRADEPTEEEIQRLVDEFKLDASLLKDALDPYEAPRFEIEDGLPYIYLRYSFHSDPPGTTPLLIVLLPDKLITVARGTPSFLDKIVENPQDVHPSDKVRLLIRILSEITARYSHSMTAIQRAVNRRKQRVDEMTAEDILEFSAHESAANMYLDALVPQANVLSKLRAGRTISVSEEELDLIEDLDLSTTQLIELGRSQIRTMRNARDAYTAISTQRLNHVIRILTALTVIVTIPNMVTGFYGMNLALPLQSFPGTAYVILFSVVAAIFATVIYFRLNKWL